MELFPIRLSLLSKRGHPFLLIRGPKGPIGHPLLKIQALFQGHLIRGVHSILSHTAQRLTMRGDLFPQATASVTKVSASKTRATSPVLKASSSTIISPVRHISIALALPNSLIRRWVPL
jgi:hypothetical protein